jgi:hypothetical protein
MKQAWWILYSNYLVYLRIDRNFCSVHEEITSIRLYTPCNPHNGLCKGVYKRMNRTNNFDQSLLINSNFFCYDIEKYIYSIQSEINLNNPKGASFKENHLMTTARDALRTTSIFRSHSLTNNLNFLNQSKHV